MHIFKWLIQQPWIGFLLMKTKWLPRKQKFSFLHNEIHLRILLLKPQCPDHAPSTLRFWYNWFEVPPGLWASILSSPFVSKCIFRGVDTALCTLFLHVIHYFYTLLYSFLPSPFLPPSLITALYLLKDPSHHHLLYSVFLSFSPQPIPNFPI